MNKIYRLVWNTSKNCWMAAAEIARSGGPRAATLRNAATLSLLGSSLLAQAASPTVTPTGSNTRSYVTANGTTVVDIATANAAGVSNNQYTQYNVNSQGLVLNNANTSQLTRQSQLAGQVYSNINLSNQASLILNQVVSSSRSTLAGFTEVLGGRADVVVANPNGITCSGCGFINTDRVTLSTGLPVLSGNGSLSGFNVSQGDILINGGGINASAQQILDLVSRSVSISGQVNVPDFGVYVGPNRWSYITRSVTGSTAPAGSAPSYAIDTAGLGGMYANRIFLVSTEAGVGVRMLGNAAANSGDFTLSAQGSIQLNNQLSATGNVAITANGSGSNLQLNDASLSAGQDLTLSSQAATSLSGSAIVAGHDLSLSAASLSDSASNNSQSNNNVRFGGNALNVAVSGSGSINGTQWGSGTGQWQASYGDLSIGSQGATLYGTQNMQLTASAGDLALGKAQLKTAGDISLSASGAISTAADTAQGIESTAGNLSLTAGTGLNNAGSISADNGSATLRIGNSLNNSGTLYAKTVLDMADASGNGSESFSNSGSGRIISDGTLSLQAGTASNSSSGWIQAAGYSSLQLASLNNAGTWLLSTGAGSTADTVSLSGALSDSGTLQSAHVLNLTASSAEVGGKLLAAGNLGISTSGNYSSDNGSFTQSGGTLTLNAAAVDNAGTFKAQALSLTASNGLSNSGTAEADGGNATLRGNGTVSNSGSLQAAGNVDIADANGNATETFSNSGTLQSGGNLLLQATTAANTGSGWIQAAGYSSLQLASLNNAGTWLLSTNAGSTADTVSLSGALSDSGTLQSAHALTLTASSVEVGGKLLAAGDLGLSTSGDYTSDNGSFTQSGGTLTLNAAAVNNAGTLKTQALSLTASNGLSNSGTAEADDGNATLRVNGTLNNTGTLYAASNLDIADASGNATEAFSNSGTLQANGNLLLQATTAANTASGWMQAAGYSSLQLAALNNAGTWLLSTNAGSTADTVNLSGALSDGGTLQSAHALNLTASSAEISGKLLAAGDLGLILGGTLSNDSNASIQSGGTLTLNATGVSNAGTLKAQALSLTASNGLSNSGTAEADGGNATLRVNGTLNNTGTLYAASNVDIADASGTASEAFSNSGTLQANGNLLLQATTATNTSSGWMQAAGYSSLQLAALNNAGTWLLSTSAGSTADTVSLSGALSDSGTLQSAHALNLTASSADVSGKLLAGGDLDLSLSGTLSNDSNASIQSGGTLTASGISTLSNSSGALLAGNKLNVSAGTLNNSGNIQGGSAADSSLTISNSLNNNSGGLINMASQTSGGGTISAGTISNSGALQSAGSVSLLLGSGGLSNSGTVLADQTLSISGQGGGRYNIAANGTIQGNTLNVTADSLSIGSGQAVQSQGDMNLDVNSLTLADSSAHIIAARSGSGTGTLTLHSQLNDTGGIYSGNDFVVNSSGLMVGQGAGLSAAGNLTVNTSSDVNNGGALYAGGNLVINAGNHVINNVGTMNGPLGTMNAGSLISLTAGVINNNSTIESLGDITLSAATIHNDTEGGDTRYLGSPDFVFQTSYEVQPYDGNLYDITYFTKTWTQQEYYANGATTLNSKPQIIGGGTVTIKNFNLVTNLAGVISANTLNLQGNVGANFTNEDLSLHLWGYQQTWEHYIKYVALGGMKYIDDPDYNDSGAVRTVDYGAIYSTHAGIYATNAINGNTFTLNNIGSAYNASIANSTSLGSAATLSSNASNSSTVSAGAVGLSGTLSATGAATAAQSSGVARLSAGSAVVSSGITLSGSISFGGLHITLPSNPNGYFVPNTQPGAHYLIETNPLMGVNSNATGSNYLLTLLGFNPDTAQTRLGDANYETYLIQQQLIAQTGNNLLKGYQSQNAEVQQLMQNAASDAKTLGLTLGQAPTAQQLSGLTQDIVWMVSTSVDGRNVLVPQVFLAPATIAGIQSGAVISASNINLKLDALNNTGGTISGSKTLDISSKGDITNNSGTISGGDVNLTSTNGSIVNQTLTEGSGNDKNYVTTVGKQAGIIATGNLNLTAAKDISNLGADMSAGGNASLAAKGNVTFDTVQDKTISSSSQTTIGAFNSSSTSSTVTTVKQLKSGLTVGGNLSVSAAKDITLAGTDASVGGNASLDAKGNVNLLDRTDTTTTHTVAKQSGLGVGGGLFGTSETTTDTSKGVSVGSSMKVGGNASVSAGSDITLRGSALDVAGSGNLNASDVKVLAGNNYETSQQQTNTTTFLKLASTSTSSQSGSDSSSTSSSAAKKGSASASAGAAASANASGQAAAGLELMDSTQTTTKDSSTHSVASSLSFGKGGSINASQDIDIAGSSVKAGGDLQLNAQQVNITAAENKTTHSSNTTETTIGLMTKVAGSADASAQADSSAQAKQTAVGTKAAASASADANANGQANLTLMDITNTQNDSSTLTHTGSQVSGGNVSINASKQLALSGSTLASDNDMQIKAGKVLVSTVQDVSTSTTQRTDVSIGLMGSSNNNANASAGVNTATVANASASASTGASSSNKLTLLQAVTGTDSSLDVVNQGSQIKAGGNLKLDAGKQLDVTGSSIAAAGNVDLTADSQHFNAAQDVHQTSSSSNTTTAGLYMDASAGANATGKIMANTGASAMLGAGYYVNNSGSSSTNGSTTAVVSQISSGGNLSRSASNDIVDTGTAISAGGNFKQTAKTITSNAASDSTYSSSSQQTSEGRVGMYAGASATAAVSGGATADASVGGTVSATHDDSQSSTVSTQARVSSIKVGGNFNSSSTQATTLEGTSISSNGDTSLKAGSLDYRAAQNTTHTTGSQANGSLSLQVNVDAEHVVGGEVSVAAGGGNSQSSSSTAVVGNMKSGGKLSIAVDNDANFAGTSLSSNGDTSVAAGGKVNFAAANSTSSASAREGSASFSAGGSTGGGVDNKQTNGMVAVGANYDQSTSQSTSKTVANIQSNGGISIRSGGDMNLEGSKISSVGGDTSLMAGGQLNITAAHDTASSNQIGAGISAGGSGGTSMDKGKLNKEASVSGGLSGAYGQSNSDSANVASISSSGNLQLGAGQNIKLEGTGLQASGTVSTNAGGAVIKDRAVSSSNGFDLSGGATLTLKKKTSTDTAATTGATTTQSDRDKQAALAKEAAELVNKKKTSASNSLTNAGNAISQAATQPETSLLDKAKNSKLGQAASTLVTQGKALKDKIPVSVGDVQGGASLQLDGSKAVDVSISKAGSPTN